MKTLPYKPSSKQSPCYQSLSLGAQSFSMVTTMLPRSTIHTRVQEKKLWQNTKQQAQLSTSNSANSELLAKGTQFS